MANSFTAANGKTYTINADGTITVGGGSAPAVQPGSAPTAQPAAQTSNPAHSAYQYSAPQPAYSNQYDNQTKKNLAEVLNRAEFSYNYENDPSYNAYAKQFLAEGDRAQRNAIAQTARYSGGLPNSWSTTAAAQAGNYYGSQLAGKIPELEQQAYQRYLQELDLNVQDVNLLNQQEQLDYAKYLDSLGQWNTNRSFDYGTHRDNVSDSQWQSEYSRALNNDERSASQWKSEYERALSNDDKSYQQWLAELEYQKSRDTTTDMNNLLSTNPIAYWKQVYADAQARGDQSTMTYAHAMAEAERAKLGYSGGIDGSQYIPLPQQKTSSGGSYGGGYSYESETDNTDFDIGGGSSSNSSSDGNSSTGGGGLKFAELTPAAQELIGSINKQSPMVDQKRYINTAVLYGKITAYDAIQIQQFLYGE